MPGRQGTLGAPAAEPRTAGPSDPGRPPAGDLALLGLGVLGAATAGPLIAATVTAPALAIAFWRNGLAALVLLPSSLRARHELRRVGARTLGLAALGGVLLAAHFGTFMPSLRYTSVASAAALVCSQVVFAALFGRLLGERLPARAWLGTVLALVGVLLVTGVDVSLSARALVGDLLALVGGAFAGGYLVVGGRVRRHLSTTLYTVVCYGVCALLLLVVCLASGQDLGGYEGHDWLRIAALTVFAQLLGHSLFNLVLRSMTATSVSLATLFHVPLAAVIAALLLGQQPPLAAIPAVVLLLVGAGLVMSARTRSTDAVSAR
jgi:drug/metabolite transporter (DMT)-like permease